MYFDSRECITAYHASEKNKLDSAPESPFNTMFLKKKKKKATQEIYLSILYLFLFVKS